MKIVGVKIHDKIIQQKVARSSRLNQQLQKVARDKFNVHKKRLMATYDSHPVTQEILGGASSSNISGTLGGYGNLFGFIGFPAGSSPTGDLRIYLENSIKLKATGKVRKSRRGVEKDISVKMPTIKDLGAVSRMPFEGGNSWVEMIEKGMSNFSYFMNKKTSKSRSGEGIQIKGKIRSESSKPTPYMTQLLERFKKGLRSKTK